MLITIKSPFIPLFFKQRVVQAEKKSGYLKATRFFGRLKGNKSYEVTYKQTTTRLIEEKPENGKRRWGIVEVDVNGENEIGSMVLVSPVKETLSRGVTNYEIKYNAATYYVKKPFMQQKNYCELKNENGEMIAVHQPQNLLRWRRDIRIEIKTLSDQDITVCLLVLSMIIFIS